jgi:hypothetical protein
MDPPTYESSSENVLVEAAETSLVRDGSHEAPQALLNLVPAQGEVSFQRGYLGYTASTVQGSLQIKFTSSDPAAYRSLVDKVTIEFAGVESINGELVEADDGDDGHGQLAHGKQQQRSRYNSSMQPLDLIRECKTLWERSSTSSARTDSSSSNTSASSSNLGPPGNLDFTFQLTDDLPHCCHLGSGSIIYSLIATLHSSTAGSLTVQTPIHLTRTSPPPLSTSITSTSNAEIYTFQHPTTISVFFPHGTSNFRRSEAIELRVRVPPPDASLVEEKGLRLRSISAELLRIITVNENGSEGEEPEITELIAKPSHRTVISRSGKAAAFTSSRSVFLHIWLQPVDPDSCESITQTTIYNEIEFRIRITASFRGRQGDREEITFFDRPVTLIPDYAPLESDNHHQRNATSASRRVVMPRTNSGYAASIRDSTAIRRSRNLGPELLQAFQNETEYDGYEQMSEGASVETAPPNIDADQPPPSIEEESSGGEYINDGSPRGEYG